MQPDKTKKNVMLLGSTGSIGKSTLDVIRLNHDKLAIFALMAHTQIGVLIDQCIEFTPRYVLMLNKQYKESLCLGLEELKVNNASKHNKIEVVDQRLDIFKMMQSDDVDIIVIAITGTAGIEFAYHASRTNKKVLLANKESLVSAGHLIMQNVYNYQTRLIPIDSEHNAIWQCLACDNDHQTANLNSINRIILTASGGPFLHKNIEDLRFVTAYHASNHPNWRMGLKISIDSATMMNKGLEIIEAKWLFNLPLNKIQVIIHPQSIIHSMVEYIDGAMIAQLSHPDMRIPIAYAMIDNQRIMSGAKYFDFLSNNDLTFLLPQEYKFPCLMLAKDAIENGGIYPVVLNAANEIAVYKFINHQIDFYDIPIICEHAMLKFSNMLINQKQLIDNIENILALDQAVKEYVDWVF